MDAVKRSASRPLPADEGSKSLDAIPNDVKAVADMLAEEIVFARKAGLLRGEADLRAFARRAIASVPRSNPLADSIGDFYDTAGLVQWLDISKQAIAKRVAKQHMVGCKTADGHWVYPAWQFDDHGEVINGVTEVLDVLLGQRDPWAAARWFVIPSPYLPGELSAIEWLSRGDDPAVVIAEARKDTERLAS